MRASIGCLIGLFLLWFLLGAAAAAAASRTIDVFLIAGQSNALGGIDSPDTRPDVPSGEAWQYIATNGATGIYDLARRNARGAWPEFAITYFTMTKRPIGFVPTAVGASSQTAAADLGFGNWAAVESGGTLWVRSVSILQQAVAAFRRAGWSPIFRGVLWSQGEADGAAINRGKIQADDYRRGLVSMIARYRSVFGQTMPFFIFETGRFVGFPKQGYLTIRRMQDSVGAADPYTTVVFRDAYQFPSLGMMQHGRNGAISPVHYSQEGYNEMGRTGAETVVCFIHAASRANCSPKR